MKLKESKPGGQKVVRSELDERVGVFVQPQSGLIHYAEAWSSCDVVFRWINSKLIG